MHLFSKHFEVLITNEVNQGSIVPGWRFQLATVYGSIVQIHLLLDPGTNEAN